MRKLLMLIVFVFLLGGVAFSQEKKEPEKAAAPVVKSWKLLPSQQKLLGSLIDEFNKKLQALAVEFLKEIIAFNIYQDIPMDVKINYEKLAFEGIPIKQKSEMKKDGK